MSSNHLHTTIKKNGAVYYYFRPPPRLEWFYGKKLVRLSDDRATAEREADEIASRRELVGPDRAPTPIELTAARRMMNNATSRAGKRRLETDLDVMAIIDMMRAQGYCCCITRLQFDMHWRKGRAAKRNAYAPSLDRRDNGKGYTKANCRIVLAAVNYAMNEWGLDTYLEIATAATRFAGHEQNVAKNFKPATNRDDSSLVEMREVPDL